ncbi:MAG: SAM-dependent methyltransferase, partial [Polyangiaceae bacterium]|nr:SAM-dependent methyltransferase [Polyangiaceae bacterium]
FPVPAAVLREVVERLDDDALNSAWTDDTTLGWVYQYWNDPEREEIHANLDAQQKLQLGDVASKTQVFTERFMVEWLLQNSLGHTWLCVCRRKGWAADIERVLASLRERRGAWRAQRARGEADDGSLPIHTDAERQWRYFVPRVLGDDDVKRAPASIDEVRLLDPACGSGHFLVVAFDLLAALYREEGA